MVRYTSAALSTVAAVVSTWAFHGVIALTSHLYHPLVDNLGSTPRQGKRQLLLLRKRKLSAASRAFNIAGKFYSYFFPAMRAGCLVSFLYLVKNTSRGHHQ